MAGGKTDKACLAILDVYPQHQKIFLSKIVDKLKSDEQISADLKIHDTILQHQEGLQSLAFDVPWRLPQCLRCDLPCPGYEQCQQPQIRWMWEHQKKANKKKRPKKVFTPYTQRCVEFYVATELEEPFLMGHSLGANTAPLAARAAFLQRRFNLPCVEVWPRLTMWRLGRSLQVARTHLRAYRNSVGGVEGRRALLTAMGENKVAFVYDQDLRLMIENNHAFEAFLCAFTAYLKFKKQTEPRPAGFPPQEDWIEFPQKTLRWKDL